MQTIEREGNPGKITLIYGSMKMKKKTRYYKIFGNFSVLLIVIFGLGLATSSALAEEDKKDKTGTDPRDF